MLHDIYMKSTTLYQEGGLDYQASRGMKEGCPRSPTLFVFYDNVFLSELKERLPEASIYAYMDDAGLVVPSIKEAKRRHYTP